MNGLYATTIQTNFRLSVYTLYTLPKLMFCLLQIKHRSVMTQFLHGEHHLLQIAVMAALLHNSQRLSSERVRCWSTEIDGNIYGRPWQITAEVVRLSYINWSNLSCTILYEFAIDRQYQLNLCQWVSYKSFYLLATMSTKEYVSPTCELTIPTRKVTVRSTQLDTYEHQPCL